jgi:hypothetical protein
MTNYAVGLGIALIAVTALRVWPLALALASVDLLAGLALWLAYRRWTGTATTPKHRADLDRLVLGQWGLSAGLGMAVALGAGVTGLEVIASGTVVRVVQAFLVAGAAALSAVFISSLVDWYWILPRIGGLGDHEAPCEAPGERWKYPTAIWLLHRGLATALVVAIIAAVPLYLAGILGSTSTKTILSVVALAVGGGMATLNQKGLASLTSAFNQPIFVGDTVLVNQPGEGEGAPVVRRRAYVVDVSVQGLKYQYLEGDDYNGPPFERKGHGPVERSNEYQAITRTEGALAVPCREYCKGVNWYCRHNGKAYKY